MYRSLAFLAILLTAAHAQTAPSLNPAVQRVVAETGHWAYTQTTQRLDRHNKPVKGATVERYDPSRPYSRQWQLVRYEGRMPTESEVLAWRLQKEAEMKGSGDEVLSRRLNLVIVSGETNSTATFLVPLSKGAIQLSYADLRRVRPYADRFKATVGHPSPVKFWPQRDT